MLRKRMAMTVSPAAAGPGWRALSEHLTELAEARSPRGDLNVLVAPGATAFTADERAGVDKDGKPKSPVPGYYMPSAARIALDGGLLPVAPERLDTSDPEHFKALAALHGVFVHELGHAVHTDSMEAAAKSKVSGAVRLLEEIRMEARAVEDRPADAKWLRAAAAKILLTDRDDDGEPRTKSQAAQLAVLTEGRVASGSLKVDDVLGVSAALEAIFDEDELSELRSIMEDTTAVADGDTDAMIAVAQRLADLVPPEEGDGEGGEGSGEGLGAAGKALGKAVKEAAEKAADEAAEDLAGDEEGEEADKTAEAVTGDPEVADELDEDAADASPSTVSHGVGGGSAAVRWSERLPEPAERMERNKLSRIFKKARWRDRDRVTLASAAPPGRMRTREAMRGAAERSMGRMVTAKPFRQTKRRVVEQPRLKVAVLVDVSGSMGPYVADVASAMWICAGAVADIQGQMIGVAFGNEARIVVEPGKPSRNVMVFPADGGFESIGSGVQLADETISLGDPSSPRLIIIVSDGQWVNEGECALGEAELARLQATGAKVIQVGCGRMPKEHSPDQAVVIEKGGELAEVVGNAAIEALKSF
jgi:hypothetical protein